MMDVACGERAVILLVPRLQQVQKMKCGLKIMFYRKRCKEWIPNFTSGYCCTVKWYYYNDQQCLFYSPSLKKSCLLDRRTVTDHFILTSLQEKAVASWFDEVKVQTSIEAHHLHSTGSFSWSKEGRNHHRDPGPVAPPCPNSNFQHQKATPSASPKERN